MLFRSEQTTQARTSFKIAKILNTISNELDIAETTRKNLIKKYDLENKENPDPNNLETFKQEMLNLMEEEIELNIEPLSISELSSMPIPVSHMMTIDFMFKD